MIKKHHITDKDKIIHIEVELKALRQTLGNIISKSEIEEYIQKLININSTLWKIEDDIRECERKKIFDKKFIDLARSVYINNDKRSDIILELNNNFGSEIIEVKSYEKY